MAHIRFTKLEFTHGKTGRALFSLLQMPPFSVVFAGLPSLISFTSVAPTGLALVPPSLQPQRQPLRPFFLWPHRVSFSFFRALSSLSPPHDIQTLWQSGPCFTSLRRLSLFSHLFDLCTLLGSHSRSLLREAIPHIPSYLSWIYVFLAPLCSLSLQLSHL